MTSKKSSFLLLSAGLALFVGACGGTEEGGASQGAPTPDVVTGPCTAEKSLCATIEVPATYASKPTKMLAALYDQLPPAGPPRAVLATVEMPQISPAAPYELKVENIDVKGEYFLYVALYNEGGGPFVPVPGIDYVVQSESKLKLTGAPINLGSMMLHLEGTP